MAAAERRAEQELVAVPGGQAQEGLATSQAAAASLFVAVARAVQT